MKNHITVDYENCQIVLSRKFAESAVPGSKEFAILMEMKSQLPDYTIVKREIAKNDTKITYHG